MQIATPVSPDAAQARPSVRSERVSGWVRSLGRDGVFGGHDGAPSGRVTDSANNLPVIDRRSAPGRAPDRGRVLARLSAVRRAATITRCVSPGLRPLPAALLALAVVFAVASFPLSAGLEGVWDTVLYPINAVVLALAGALIVSRQRAHPIGWILLGMGVEAAFVELTEGYGYHAAYLGSVVSEWLSSWGSILGASMTATVLALFPTGRPARRRWRPVVWAAIAGTVLTVIGTAFGHSADDGFRSGSNPYAVDGPLIPGVYMAGQVLFGVALLGAIASLIVRFRRSTGIERQQLKWVAYVVCALAVVGPLAICFYFDSVAVQIAIAIVVTALPVAICVAILRYRLYDIDIIINRTLVYGVVTLLVAAAYVITALALGAIVGTRHSAWVTAGATLAAVASFDRCGGASRTASIDASARRATTRWRGWRTSSRNCARAEPRPTVSRRCCATCCRCPTLSCTTRGPMRPVGISTTKVISSSLDQADGRTYSAIERAASRSPSSLTAQRATGRHPLPATRPN